MLRWLTDPQKPCQKYYRQTEQVMWPSQNKQGLFGICDKFIYAIIISHSGTRQILSFLSFFGRVVFQQTEKSFGGLINLVGKFFNNFPNTPVDCFWMKTRFCLFDFQDQFRPTQTSLILLKQLKGYCIDSSRDCGFVKAA